MDDSAMITREFVSMMAKYNLWINTKLYGVCASMTDAELKANRGAFFKSIYGTLDHILVADLAFIRSFTREGDEVAPTKSFLYPVFSEMLVARQGLDARLIAWSESVTPEWMQSLTTFESRIDRLPRTVSRAAFVAHMFNHQTHHRGQVTTLLSQMGYDLGVTDLHGSFPPAASGN